MQVLSLNRGAALGLIAGAALGLTGAASAQTVFYFESFNGAVRNQQSQDPTLDGACGANANVWTQVGPPGWTVDDCGVATFFCRPGSTCSANPPFTPTNCSGCTPSSGIIEWEGWCFAKKDWWVVRAEDQDRSQFTLGTNIVAIADPDEWDDSTPGGVDCGKYNAFMTSPAISLVGADLSTLNFAFASSWRDESFDDGDFTNNQTATIVAIYQPGDVRVEVLRWDSDPLSPFFHDDDLDGARNEAVLLTAADLEAPVGATSVRLEFGLTNAANDWWWAIDNLELTGTVSGSPTTIYSEGFEGVTLGPAVEELATCTEYCGQNVYTHTGPGGVNVTVDPSVTGGVADWLGWSFAEVAYWNCVSGQGRGGFTLGDGLVAIADGDEWTDRSPNSGTLITALATPSINIAGRSGNLVILSFDSSWLFESGQTATVTASFDGGTPVEVLRWESDAGPFFKDDAVNESVFLPIDVPGGASAVVFSFNYTAGNNWWWAIDDVRVFEGQVSVTIDSDCSLQSEMTVAPTTNFAPCFTPWAPDAPVGGWTEVFNFTAPGGPGRPEWSGWSFAHKDWWSQVEGDQNRSFFTRASGYIAVADSDAWDDAAGNQDNFDATLTSPDIALPGVITSIQLNFDSSWRPETIQQATVKAIYTLPGPTTSTVTLRTYQSTPFLDPPTNSIPNPNFVPDSENEAVSFNTAQMAVPPGATAVRFEFRKFDAENNWWFAIDNLELVVNGSQAFFENFENPQNLQAPIQEPAPTTLCRYFSTVAEQQNGFSADNSANTACDLIPGTAEDFDGFNAWLTEAWARGYGGLRGQFGSRTAYVSDHASGACTGTAIMLSPIYDVRNANPGTLALSFRSGWLSAPGHVSRVEVSYDGGPYTPVLTWNSIPSDPNEKMTNPNEVVALNLANPVGSDTAQFRFVDINSGYWAICEMVLTATVGVTPCPLDLSGNDIVDADDIFAFLNLWFAGPPGAACSGCTADWNNDGFVTADDIFAYLNNWFAFGPGLPCP